MAGRHHRQVWQINPVQTPLKPQKRYVQIGLEGRRGEPQPQVFDQGQPIFDFAPRREVERLKHASGLHLIQPRVKVPEGTLRRVAALESG